MDEALDTANGRYSLVFRVPSIPTNSSGEATQYQIARKLEEFILTLARGGTYSDSPGANGKYIDEWVLEVIEKKNMRFRSLHNTLTEIAAAALEILEMTRE